MTPLHNLFSFLFGPPDNDGEMPETQAFRIKYDGEALADHSIDINDLAPALMSLADLMNEADRVVNDGDSTIKIKIKATETGSFQIYIQTIHAALHEGVNLLTNRRVEALATLIFLVSSINGEITLFGLIKKLCGKLPKSVKNLNESEVEIETDEGSYSVSKWVWDMYKSQKIRKAAYGVLKPLEQTGIESVEFIDEEKKAFRVTRAELSSYVPPEMQDEVLRELPERELYVYMVHVWLKGGDHKWKFSEGVNGAEWSATMKDENFQRRVISGDIAIRANDRLKVRLKQIEYKSGDEIKYDYEITEVLEYKPGASQTTLI